MPEVTVVIDSHRNLTTEELTSLFAELLTKLSVKPANGWFIEYVVRPEGKITIEIEA